MRSIYLLLFAFSVETNAGNVWLKDLISPKGWNLGYGVVLKLNESHKGRNVPLMERLSLDINLGELIGVSVGKAKSDGVELDFYVKKNVDYQEGREKKNKDNRIMSMMIGYKVVMVISAIFAVMKMMTLKAIFLAKAALLISIIVLLTKMKSHAPEIIEVEQHGYPPHHYIEKEIGYHGFGGGNGGAYGHYNYGKEAQPSNTYHDYMYAPSSPGSSVAESSAVYAAVTPNESTAPIALSRSGQDIERKRDTSQYRKIKEKSPSVNVLSIKKISSDT